MRVKRNQCWVKSSIMQETSHWCAACSCRLFLPSPTVSSSCTWTDSWRAAAWHWQLPLDRAGARRVEAGPRNGYWNKTNIITQCTPQSSNMLFLNVLADALGHSSDTDYTLIDRLSLTNSWVVELFPRVDKIVRGWGSRPQGFAHVCSWRVFSNVGELSLTFGFL